MEDIDYPRLDMDQPAPQPPEQQEPTIEELEKTLQEKFTNQVIGFTPVRETKKIVHPVAGKIDRISLSLEEGDLIVRFIIHDHMYTCSYEYFMANHRQYGNS